MDFRNKREFAEALIPLLIAASSDEPSIEAYKLVRAKAHAWAEAAAKVEFELLSEISNKLMNPKPPSSDKG